ncbi:MAG: hypothetical protein JETT_0487 [Candidatus Jettenia ecosi]|uniref:Uncharacterized protein n=1 Tax=Candidatus Jettenia ecosi TaxID=2494326 RepID=A0A533QEJ0_9BACT|nr:MAG: hypothetical protein JETT_0487 [Candidatus Jettenia ecosi]
MLDVRYSIFWLLTSVDNEEYTKIYSQVLNVSNRLHFRWLITIIKARRADMIIDHEQP